MVFLDAHSSIVERTVRVGERFFAGELPLLSAGLEDDEAGAHPAEYKSSRTMFLHTVTTNHVDHDETQ